jgi:hypothetical protein
MRLVLNACNFVGAARVIQEGIAVDPLLVECELKARDLYQTKFDILKWIARVRAKRHDLPRAQGRSYSGLNDLRSAYVQILRRHALRRPWPLCGFIPETEGLSRIYTGLEKHNTSAPVIFN